MRASRHRFPRIVAATAAVGLLVGGCAGDDEDSAADADGAGGGELQGVSLQVGSKEFTESKVLAQITAQVLTDAGAEVETTELTGSATVREALESGDIDAYWEYTGTGWVNILGHTSDEAPEDLFAQVSEEDAENGVTWLEPAPLNDTYRIAVTKEFAEENDIRSMSDAVGHITDNRSALCAASEFIQRDDGLPGLEKAYDVEFGDVVELDLGLIYAQIGERCDFGEVFSTDGRILANDLVVLEDDQTFFIDYNAALTLRQEVADEHPAIADLMGPVSEALTTEEITRLNAAVDVDGEEPADVAEEWLQERKLLG